MSTARTRTMLRSLLNGVKLWVPWCPAAEDHEMRRWLMMILGHWVPDQMEALPRGAGNSSVGFEVYNQRCTLYAARARAHARAPTYIVPSRRICFRLRFVVVGGVSASGAGIEVYSSRAIMATASSFVVTATAFSCSAYSDKESKKDVKDGRNRSRVCAPVEAGMEATVELS
jgi:hypothetical protein